MAGKVTVACKYNVLRHPDGFFREVAEAVVRGYPGLTYEQFIVDDFARRPTAPAQRIVEARPARCAVCRHLIQQPARVVLARVPGWSLVPNHHSVRTASPASARRRR